jgi:cell division protein FtsZ
MQRCCDTVIAIPNQKLISIVDQSTTVIDAFRLADSILLHATRAISDLINVHGLINLDFADVETIMYGMGDAIMGTGIATGEERAVLAAQQAISSPLLEEVNIGGAQGVLVNITGGDNLTLHEVDEATSIIFEEAGNEANIIFGAVIDPTLEEEIRVTVIATGFHQVCKLIDNGIPFPLQEKTPFSKMEASKVTTMENKPAYQKKMTTDEKTEDETQETPGSKLTFGGESDDLEIPAFLRQQNQ